CDEQNVQSLGDLPHGQGWAYKKAEFRGAFQILMSVLPCTFITHEKTREERIKGTKETIQYVMPSLERGSLEFINGKVDIIGYLHTKTGNPMLTTKPSDTIIAGSRFPEMVRDWDVDPKDM